MGSSCSVLRRYLPKKILPEQNLPLQNQNETEEHCALIHLRSILDIHHESTHKQMTSLQSLLNRVEEVYGVLETRYAGKKDEIFVSFVLDNCLGDVSLHGVKLSKESIQSIIESLLGKFLLFLK